MKTIKIPKFIHRKIKILAASKETTIYSIIIEAIEDYLEKEAIKNEAKI